MKLAIGLAALSLVSTAAVAGGPATPISEPEVTVSANPVSDRIDWSGPYVGLSLGISSADGSTTGTAPVSSRAEYGLDGGSFGGHVGYLWQNDAFVYGVEVGIDSWKLSGDDGGAFGVTDGIEGEWLGSIRGRLGYATGRTLVYGALGLTFAKLSVDQTSTAPAASASTSFTETGWSAGLGLEHAISDKTTIGIEYRYLGFPGEFETPTNSVSFPRTHEIDDLQSLSLRLSYRF